MDRITAEAIVEARRKQEGRNFEKDHSMDECVARLQDEGRRHESRDKDRSDHETRHTVEP